MRHKTNLQFIGISRPKLRDGDIIRMVLIDGRNAFGRITIASLSKAKDAEVSVIEGVTVMQIFRPGLEPSQIPQQRNYENYLIAPVVTNRLGFTQGGVMEVVGNVEPDPSWWPPNDVFRARHFSGDPKKTIFVDLWGRRVDERGVPEAAIGNIGVVSYRWIDDAISDALGITRAPLQEGD